MEVSGTKEEIVNRLLTESDLDSLVNHIYNYLHEEDMKEICEDLSLATLDSEEEFYYFKEKLWRRIMVFTNNFERGFGRWAHWHLFPRAGLFAMVVGMMPYIIALIIIYGTPHPVYNTDSFSNGGQHFNHFSSFRSFSTFWTNPIRFTSIPFKVDASPTTSTNPHHQKSR